MVLNPAFSEENDLSEVRLTFTQDGQPLSGVTMYVNDDEEVTTNENGKASISVYSGVHAITLEYDDLDVADLNIVVSFGETVSIIAETQANADIPSIDIVSTGVKGANSVSGSGTISGQVLSGIDNEPVPNAKIIVLGSAAEVITDSEGNFIIENIPGGSYGMTITQDDYKSYSLDHFVVVANEPINLDMQLFPIMKASIDAPIDGIEIEEVIVTAKYVADESSIAGALESVRLSADVTELISADQIAKSGASDAAAALNRVAGVNVGGDGFANIRGLPARYSKTTWNGSELPSTDPVRRTIPLDLFPTDVLKGIEVLKSYSADKPGEFAGGLIDLQTISIPDEDYFKISIGTGGNTETTFRRGLTYEGGGGDFFGSDDGTRDYPDLIDQLTDKGRKALSLIGSGPFAPPCTPSSTLNCVTLADLEFADDSFANNLRVREKKINPDVGLSLAGGKRWDQDWYTFGFNTAFSFDNEWQSTSGIRNQVPGVGPDGSVSPSPSNFNTEVRTENEITLGGLFAMGLEFGESTGLQSNTFYYRLTTDTTAVQNTVTGDRTNENTTLQWIENELFSQQFLGQHDLASYFRLPVGLDFNWSYLLSRTSRDVPDRVTYGYTDDLANATPPNLAPGGIRHEYDFTIDKTRNFRADLDLALWEETSFPTTLSTGYSYLTQRRSNNLIRFAQNLPVGQPITDPNPEVAAATPGVGLGINIFGAGPAADFDGSQKVSATYIAVEQGLFDFLRLNAGVRFEDASINVNGITASGPSFNATVDDYDELPSIFATWFINDSMQLRAAWSETLTRPNIRELSPIPFDDNVLREDFLGNPNLVSSKIDNRDVRFEWYFGDDENLTIGYFEKDILNPIEVISFSVASDTDPFDLTFANGTEADVEGWEFSWRKNLGFFSKIGLPDSIMENFYFYGNYSVIDSETEVDRNASNARAPAQLGTVELVKSALTGQPDWLANVAIGYESDDIEATLLYNQVADFISAVGTTIAVPGSPVPLVGPDFINNSQPSLDFIYKQRIFDNFKLGFNAKNILNPEMEITQGGIPVTAFHNGREYSLSLSWEPEKLN